MEKTINRKQETLRLFILEDSTLFGMQTENGLFRFPPQIYGKLSTMTQVNINRSPSAGPISGSTIFVDASMYYQFGLAGLMKIVSNACRIKFPNALVGVAIYYATEDDLMYLEDIDNCIKWEELDNLHYIRNINNDTVLKIDEAFFEALEEDYDDYDIDDDDDEDEEENYGPQSQLSGFAGVKRTSHPRSPYHDLVYGEDGDEETDDLDELAAIIAGKKKKSSKGKKHYTALASFKHGDHVKKDVARHGIMISEKKYYQRDKKIIKGILKDLIPGDSNWVCEYRKAVLNRWMRCLVITEKEAKERRKAHKKAQRSKSVARKTNAINGITKNIINRYSDPFYDPKK